MLQRALADPQPAASNVRTAHTAPTDHDVALPRSARPARATVRLATQPPAHVYFVVSAVFTYLGPSFAVLLFARVQVLGVLWLRIVSAAVILAAGRRPRRALGSLDRRGRQLLFGWGIVLAAMNCCYYVAISRLPLGTVAAIEYVPVIALAAIGARSARNALALALAVAGVSLVADIRLAGALVGFTFAFANAVLFAAYIVLADRVAKRPQPGGVDGLAVAMIIAAVVVTPIGGWQAARAFSDPILVLAGVGVGLCSSVIPYGADQLALARLPRATYATMVALFPAFATIIGIIVLTQIPSWIETAGVALVIAGVALHRPAHLANRRKEVTGNA
jgi:inner membrane transporter RhtA